MNERSGRPWPVYLLGLAAVGAIVAAVLVVGPPSQSTASTTRIVTAQRGVVQSTVSGSGNVEAARQLDLGFKTSGVVSHIYVSQGQHVVQGQLLAELDPESTEVSLEQARATLKTAEATLAQEEETNGEAGSSGSGAHAASVDYATLATASPSTANGTSAAAPEESTSGSTSSGQANQGASPTENAATTPEGTGTAKKGESRRSSPGTTSSSQGATAKAGTGATSGSTGSGSTLSSAARSANIASARAAVKSDKLAVQSAEQALTNTKLYAPETGTVVSLSGEVGETVSATGTTRASSSSSSESSSSASSAASSAAAGSSAGGGTGSSGSGDSSASAFAVLSDLSSMQLVVPMSESEIGEVKVGQPASVAIEALEGRKMAAEVSAISDLPTSNSGVVSYDVTFTLEQLTAGLRPGMSATAEVVVKQAEGVNVPTSAVTGGQVTVIKEGKQTRRSVVTGLAGNTTTIVVSGLSAGEQVALPTATSSSSSSSLLSRLGSRLGGAGGLGGTGGLGGGGAFRGGGGGGFAVPALGG